MRWLAENATTLGLWAYLLIGFVLGWLYFGSHSAEAGNLESADPYAYYQVTGNDSYLVRYNPQTGDSWVLACPTGATKDCAWDPIEVRDDVP
jgi:hypothetical protein